MSAPGKNPDLNGDEAPDLLRDTERSVLAAMLLGGEAIERASGLLGADDLCRDAHKQTFEALLALHERGEPADSLTLADELLRRGDLDAVGGRAFISAILEMATTTANIEAHASRIIEAACKRRLLKLGARVQQLAHDPTQNPGNIVAAITTEIEALAAGRTAALEYIDLAAMQATGIPPVPWIIEGWLAEGDIALFSGDGGIGKSTTAAALGVAVATGGAWCGFPVLRTGPVLVFDEEQSEGEVGRIYLRLGAPCAGLRVAVQQSVNLTTAAGLERIERELRQHRPLLVILDSVQQVFAGVDGNRAEAVAEVYAKLFRLRRLYGCTFLLLGHLRKPPTEGHVSRLHMALGSVAFGTQASTTWVATQPARDLLDIVQTKRRGAERTSLRTRYATEGPNAPITLTGEGTVDEGETATEKAEDFVLAYLIKHGTSQTKWIVAAGEAEVPPLSERSIKRALERMTKVLKVIVRPKRGYYGLAQPPSP